MARNIVAAASIAAMALDEEYPKLVKLVERQLSAISNLPADTAPRYSGGLEAPNSCGSRQWRIKPE